MENEEWRVVPQFENYEVSNMGRIRKRDTGQELVCGIGKIGYCKVTLRKGAIKKTFSVHRLVALAFISNPDNKPEVNHINGIKHDNCVSNLEWATPKENVRHAIDLGLINVKGSNCPFSRLNAEQVLEIRRIGRSMSQAKIGKLFGVHETVISRILNRKIWKHI